MDNKDKRDMLPEDEYLKQMSSLPKVKAPDDFLRKVRERIERRTFRERMVDALFVPFRIKIPLEVAAVTVTLLLVISSLDVVKPSKQLAYVPAKIAEYKESRLCEKEAATVCADSSEPALELSKGFYRADVIPAIKGYVTTAQGAVTHIETDKNTGLPLYIDAEIPVANYESFRKKLEDPSISRNIRIEPILKEAPQGRNIIQIRIFVI